MLFVLWFLEPKSFSKKEKIPAWAGAARPIIIENRATTKATFAVFRFKKLDMRP